MNICFSIKNAIFVFDKSVILHKKIEYVIKRDIHIKPHHTPAMHNGNDKSYHRLTQ